jgi:nitronate monooxygenase
MGLGVPIVNAPMGGAAGGRLAAAVSRAGGLGMVGMGSSATAAVLDRELAAFDAHGLPLGIGLVHWVMKVDPGLLEVALAARPALLSVSFGDDWTWVDTAHAAEVTVAAQVADVESARRAAGAGVDVLVARGAEGGGHGEPRIGTLPLLAEVLDAVDIPVLAAGGIATARALAAVLAAGASAAWVGTAFAVCTEALTGADARARLLAAESDATMTTRVFDIAQHYPWPATIPERVLRDEFAERWDGREDELSAAVAGRDHPVTVVNAGQGIGAVGEARTAADLIASLCDGAAALLGRWR